MAKKVTGYIKLQIPAGKATPAPPVGPALGQHGVNIVEFTKQFNARTADKGDLIIPVVITVYADRSFSFITKTPPAAVLLKKACKLQKASGVPNKEKVATISKDEVKKIAEMKMPDLNAASIESAMSMIAGTARSMGRRPPMRSLMRRSSYMSARARTAATQISRSAARLFSRTAPARRSASLCLQRDRRRMRLRQRALILSAARS